MGLLFKAVSGYLGVVEIILTYFKKIVLKIYSYLKDQPDTAPEIVRWTTMLWKSV